MSPRLLLIVGLQKSGTTLLSRLLQQSGLAHNPFRTEGNDFWGNEPPFAPTGFPAGRAYQESGGEAGHEMEAAQADEETARVLAERLAALSPGPGVALNKNPYNSVRIPWLRALWPEAVIVSLVRRPAANVFSLLKKFSPHDQSGLAPEEGWWGVKPRGWRALRSDDRVRQCARQWEAVNARIERDRGLLDAVVAYHDLCARPAEIVADLVERCTGCRPDPPAIEPVRCFDDELERGARLRSKNRYFRERGDLSTPEDEPVELEALSSADLASIEEICGPLAGRLSELR